MLDAVDRLNTLQNIFDRIVHRIFAGLDCQTLVSHVLKRRDLLHDLLLCQLLSGNVLVFQVIRAVYTAVHTVVGKIQRCKQHDTVAVKVFLDLLRQRIDFLDFFRDLTGEQHRCLSVI